MNLNTAIEEVNEFFINYGANLNPVLVGTSKGKVYELYCLAKTVEYLKVRPGVSVRLVGTSVDFKSSPGKVDKTRSYFVISGNGPDLELHTDIEVRTLSSAKGAIYDRSSYHEVDLVLLTHAYDRQRPKHDQIVLGIECKAHANFRKDNLRHVLGVRRELSFFCNPISSSLESVLGPMRRIKSYPPSEYWLAFSDPMGMRYRSGPRLFGIEFMHWCPT